MDDFHIISGPDTETKPNSSKQFAPLLVALLITVSLGTGVYYYQRQSVQGVQTEEEPKMLSAEIPEHEEGVTVSSPSPVISQNPDSNVTFSKTILLKSIAEKSGFISEDGLVAVANRLKAGNDGTLHYHGVITFGLSDLPQGVAIGKATLRLYQTEVKGNPFSLYGNAKLVHVSLGDSLDANDFNDGTLDESTTIPQTTASSWKELDVTEMLKKDLSSAKTDTQYRIQFTNEKPNSSGKEHSVYFESPTNTEGTGNTPQFIVNF